MWWLLLLAGLYLSIGYVIVNIFVALDNESSVEEDLTGRALITMLIWPYLAFTLSWKLLDDYIGKRIRRIINK